MSKPTPLPDNFKQWHYMVNENAKISELKTGDLILSHGVIWKLTDHRTYEKQEGEHSDVHVFDTHAIGYWNRKDQCSFPDAWLGEYKLQSNDLAGWAIVADNSYSEDECSMCHCEDATVLNVRYPLCDSCYTEMKVESDAAGQDFKDYWDSNSSWRIL